MCGVKTLNNWNNDEDTVPYTSLLKQGLNYPSLLRRMSSVIEIKPQKKKDVERILVSQFGDNWVEHPEIEWYKEVILVIKRLRLDQQTPLRLMKPMNVMTLTIANVWN
ncbi:hypothetical protein EVAR_60240_1 [Eumeta japonica]|uniref:Uncharacterized protein n=1 Tax=Eumeta variegata TaxID=151549 RepID=A0A4C1ZTK7_EUMVA|nr:hypothetical protein EVAR_60240_1 [Eumeta japonica]